MPLSRPSAGARGGRTGEVVTYDRRMVEAARLLGLTAVVPGAELSA